MNTFPDQFTINFSTNTKSQTKNYIGQVELEELFFPVKKVNMLNSNSRSSNSEGIFGLRDGEFYLFSMVSKKYQLFPNEKFFGENGVFPNALKDYNYTVKARENNGIFTVDYQILSNKITNEDYTKVFKVGDIARPAIRVTHSYTGTSSLYIQFIWHRLVCSNGLQLPDSKIIKLSHKTNFENFEFEIEKYLNEMIHSMQLKKMENWMNYKITDAQIISDYIIGFKNLIEEKELKIPIKQYVNTSNGIEYVSDIVRKGVEAEQKSIKGFDLFGLFNVAQQILEYFCQKSKTLSPKQIQKYHNFLFVYTDNFYGKIYK